MHCRSIVLLVKILFTATMLSIGITLVWGEKTTDTIILIWLLIALWPWIASGIRRIEVPFIKVEFKDHEDQK